MPEPHDLMEVTSTCVRCARTGRPSFSTKLYEEIGAIPDTVKSRTFNRFIPLYCN